MSKTIDVRETDSWSIDAKKPFVGQFRDGALIRVIHPDRIVTENLVAESVWHLGGIHSDIAACVVTAWGYQITRDPAEGKPATVVDVTGMTASVKRDRPEASSLICSKCKTFGCDHHTIPAAKPEPATRYFVSDTHVPNAAKPEAEPNPSVCPDCQFTLSAPACNGEHQRKWDDLHAKRANPEPLTFMDDRVERTEKVPTDSGKVGTDKPADVPATVKPELTVPVVDAVWVHIKHNDEEQYLTPHAGLQQANKSVENVHTLSNGTARIVRIRSVDEEARFLAHHANERLDQHVNRLAEAHARIDALESRIAAVTEDAGYARQIADNQSDRVDELVERVKNVESRLADKPADKPSDTTKNEIDNLWNALASQQRILDRMQCKPADKDAARISGPIVYPEHRGPVPGFESPKPAARVVKLKCPEHVTREYRLGWNKAIEMAKEALTSQGITVEAAE